MNPANATDKTIAIIGLGYVGLPLAVEFGKLRPVIGFDINTKRIAELQAGSDYTLETEPEELKRPSNSHSAHSSKTSAQHAFTSSPCPLPLTNTNAPT